MMNLCVKNITEILEKVLNELSNIDQFRWDAEIRRASFLWMKDDQVNANILINKILYDEKFHVSWCSYRF